MLANLSFVDSKVHSTNTTHSLTILIHSFKSLMREQ